MSMRYSQGDGVHTSLSRLVLYPSSDDVGVIVSLRYCAILDYPRHGHVLYGTIIIKIMCKHQLYLQG